MYSVQKEDLDYTGGSEACTVSQPSQAHERNDDALSSEE